MVINDALKAVARQRRHISLDAQEDSTYQKLVEQLEATADEPEDIFQRNELSEAIMEALHTFSPRQRAVIVQRYYLGFSEREMSKELDCSLGTIKWHLNTARKRLRALLLPFIE
jgi:RNA polymerase sigma-70 factor (ECF subfamily)